MKGKINSIESMGTLDGPGVRCVIFFQGCPLRCKYCHNPETWGSGGKEYSSDKLFSEVLKFKNYFGNKGGVTLSGGEPLMQADFLLEFCQRCKNEGINIALDTSGCLFNEKVMEILKYVDLVILDVKHWNAEEYEKLTGGKIYTTLEFLDYVNGKNKIWVRQVVFPWTTTIDMDELVKILAGKVIEKVELLAFHNMAAEKWEKLGLKYEFTNVENVTSEKLNEMQRELDGKMS